MLNDVKIRGIVLQIVILAAFSATLVAAALTASKRIQEQGIAYGFGILSRPTGFNVTSILADQTIRDPYWWTICVAMMNTIMVATLGIILASIVGFTIGVLRHAGNPLLSRSLGIYVEIFRNVPLLLQLVFWYVTFTRLPPAREAIELLPSVWLSNSGLNLPAIWVGDSGWLALVAVAVGLVLAFVATRLLIANARPSAVPPFWWRLIAVLAGFLTFCIFVALVAEFEEPEFRGFNFRNGLVIPVELFALVFSITVFSSAYIAEVVRGGLQSVPKGQWEAAEAMSLSSFQVYSRVALPIALRSIIPSLGNQYVFVVKATALGIAVGFSDLFSTSVAAITQSGQTLEFLAVLMGIYLVLDYSLSISLNLLNRRLSLTRR